VGLREVERIRENEGDGGVQHDPPHLAQPALPEPDRFGGLNLGSRLGFSNLGSSQVAKKAKTCPESTCDHPYI
jgi:hypothetical protein